MSIHVTLFSGASGWAIGILSLIGACAVLWQVEEWLGDRIEVRLPFRLSRRAYRPGAWVQLPDGRPGRVLYLFRDREFTGPLAAVQPYDDDQQALPAEMVPAARLSVIDYGEAA